jgi:hypothetical protein
MTSAALDNVPSVLDTGFVPPAFRWEPPGMRISDDSKLVADECADAGFEPDAEQMMILDAIFALGPDGYSAAFEIAAICTRQNLKTAAFEMAALGWLFLTDEELVIWSAHLFSTAEKTFAHLEKVISNHKPFHKRLARNGFSHGNGDESIKLKTGGELAFRTRNKDNARGLTGSKVILDEAYALQDQHMGALMPTMAASPDGQVLYGSSAGMARSAVLRDIRDRGRPGGDESLAYYEWCAPDPAEVCAAGDACMHARNAVGCGCDKPELWQLSNPASTPRRYVRSGMGPPRIRLQTMAKERRSMPPHEFGREFMGWWDQPVEGMSPITTAAWERTLDQTSKAVDPVSLAVAISLDRSMSAIGVAGWRPDGKAHVELIEHRPGTGWTLRRLVELAEKYNPCCVILRPDSPAGAFEKQMTSPPAPGKLSRFAVKPEPGRKTLQDGQIQLHLTTSREYAQSCGSFADAVVNESLRQIGQKPLDDAVEGARTHESAGAWIWWPKDSPADITPVEAVTLALHGLVTYGRKKPPPGPFVLVGR